MKLSKTILIPLFIFTICGNVQAQFWKKLKKKAEEKISKMEDKVIDNLDKNTDKNLEEAINGNKDSLATSAKVKLPNTFNFNKSIEVEITSNKRAPVNLEFLFGKREDIYGMSMNSAQMGAEGNMVNIITPKGITMFMEMSGMKIKKSVSQKQIASYNFKDKAPKDIGSIKKTGASKTILGYHCEEYKYTDKDNVMLVWVTQDFPIKKTSFPMFDGFDDNIFKGFALEMNMKNGKEETQMKVIKFDKNKNFSINTTEYKSLGF